jgi:hypothetical protein
MEHALSISAAAFGTTWMFSLIFASLEEEVDASADVYDVLLLTGAIHETVIAINTATVRPTSTMSFQLRG